MTKGGFDFQDKVNYGDTLAENIKANVSKIRNESTKERFADFEDVEHRLEFVANIYGVEYINDSKATNTNSTWYALERMNNQVVWIVGGVDKAVDYSSLSLIHI
jgi:UDP-N-acetylmuramoylalanine--D-glutamate ligase